MTDIAEQIAYHTQYCEALDFPLYKAIEDRARMMLLWAETIQKFAECQARMPAIEQWECDHYSDFASGLADLITEFRALPDGVKEGLAILDAEPPMLPPAGGPSL